IGAGRSGVAARLRTTPRHDRVGAALPGRPPYAGSPRGADGGPGAPTIPRGARLDLQPIDPRLRPRAGAVSGRPRPLAGKRQEGSARPSGRAAPAFFGNPAVGRTRIVVSTVGV